MSAVWQYRLIGMSFCVAAGVFGAALNIHLLAFCSIYLFASMSGWFLAEAARLDK